MDHQINPLLINHVVEKILDHINLQESTKLLSLRLVCNVWNHAGIKCFRKNSKHFITFGIKNHSITEIEELISLIKSSSTFPCGNFNFYPEIFQQRNVALLLCRFFVECGVILRCLVIRMDDRSLVSIPQDFVATLHNLSSLDFSDERKPLKAFDNLLNVLLNASKSNLVTLSIRRKVKCELDEDEGVLDRICDAFRQEDSVLKQLKNLTIDVKLNNELLQCLSQQCVNNSLKSLKLNLKQSTFEGHYLYEFLNTQKHSLQRLTLLGLCKETSFRFTFPKLRSLHYLGLYDGCAKLPFDENNKKHFRSLSISENFPKMKELDLNTRDKNWIQLLLGHSPTLETLKMPKMFQDALLINPISVGFPNLKRLELYYQPTVESTLMFWSVFECLQNLEELTILQSNFSGIYSIDPLLTGITEEECMRMLRINNFSLVMSNQIDFDRPSLKNLKKLKILDLIGVLSYHAFITDVTAYALMTLDRLEHLKISRSKIKQNCFYQLYTRFPHDLQHEMKFASAEKEDKEEFAIDNCTIM